MRKITFGHKDKYKVLQAAKKEGLKVIWLDDKGLWHGAKNRDNTPNWALESHNIEDITIVKI